MSPGRKKLCLRIVANRSKLKIHEDQTAIRADAFLRAYALMKGLGSKRDGEWKEWNSDELVERAQQIAWYAIHKPLWRDVKRWKGRETAK